MKRWSALLLALVMVFALAACGSNGDKPSDGGAGSVPETSAVPTEQAAPEASAPNTASPTDARPPTEEPVREGAIDQFIFRTSDETRAFLQDYDPSGTLKFGEPYWREFGKEFTIQGTLMPDRSAFLELNAEPETSDISEAKDLLLEFYQTLREKTGLDFPGAEAGIQALDTLEDSVFYEADGFWFILRPQRRNASLVRVNSEFGAVPYGPDDAYAFLQDHGGWTPSMSRSVSGTTEMDWSWKRECPYGWSARLNQNDCLSEVEAEYFAEDLEAAKAYFTAVTEFYLTGDVREEALRFLSEQFDALEPGSSESVRIADYYSLNLSYYSVFRYWISLDNSEIPATAQPFPNAEEQAALLLDPITRRGISREVQMPETNLYEYGEMKVVLNRVFYTDEELRIQLLFEDIPENANVRIELEQINGQPIDPVKEIDMLSSISADLSARDVKEPVIERVFRVSLDPLLEVYEYTELQSLTFGAYYYEKDEEEADDYYYSGYSLSVDLGEVTVEASK